MPTYEYACSSCGHTWEDFQKISADPTKICPNCQQETAQRQISGGNFILKGGGWYADLYSSSGGSKGKSEPSSSDKPAASSSEKTSTSEKSSGGEAKTETKSAAPAAPAASTSGSSGGKSD